MTASITRFDHAMLTSKALCIQFLREFGVPRDWARCTLPEMLVLLRKYSDDRMFEAAEKIVTRDGDTYDRADFEIDADDADDLDADDADNEPAPAPAPAVRHRPVSWMTNAWSSSGTFFPSFKASTTPR